MVVHSVIALAGVAALGFVMEASGAGAGSITTPTWAFLWRAALVGMLVAALPATVSGITERGHMYVNWHGSHRAKLALSLALLALVSGELVADAAAIGAVGVRSWLGAAVVLGNPIACLGLSFFGLRITLGRQALARTSYVPDMFRTPPVDIRESSAAHVGERARVIEVLQEAS
jgi:hypothetical protein